MKYKVGDRVRIVSDRTKNMSFNGNMDKYLGTVMTIKEAHKTFIFGIPYHYRMVEDKGEWFWNDEMIAGLASETPFDFGAWRYKKVCMHCKTEEEAEEFCREMSKAGLRWSSGNSYLSWSCFEPYKEQTCYCFNKGTYESTGRAKNKGYTILEWADYRSTEPPKEEQEKTMETKIDDKPLNYQEVTSIYKRLCEHQHKKDSCRECPVSSFKNYTNKVCRDFIIDNSDIAEPILKKWAAEHPVKTNRDKFTEVFGKCEFVICSVVPCSKCDWWDQEYVEPFEEKE
nr:MAG TPA: hypothetical protein [Caudoviricetes sp.]